MESALRRNTLLTLSISMIVFGTIGVGVSHAAVEVDRLYRMGEDDLSQSGSVFDTFDSAFVDGVSFVDAQDLTAAGSSPQYISLGAGGLNDPLPGSVSSSTAIQFSGSNYVTGDELGVPATTVSNTNSQSPILGSYDDLTGRGFQFWARPGNAGSGSTQTLLSDDERHAVIIDSNGFWRARFDNTFRTSSIQASADTWAHVMLVSPTGTTGATFYVDGVAAVGFSGGYSNPATGLFIGSRNATSEFYTGVIDEVEMFVLGDTGTVDATFNYATDNRYFTEVFLPSQSGYGSNDVWITGDSDFDGDVDTADVNAFLANWLTERTVTGGVAAGDYSTIMTGDFDVDGDIDRQDFFLLRQANPAAVAAVFASVPEPSPVLLAAAGVMALALSRRHINDSRHRPCMPHRLPAMGARAALLAAAMMPVAGVAQTITWDAGGDGVSVYQEANWTNVDDVAGTDPVDDTVNPNIDIAVNLLVDGVSTAGGPVGAGGPFRMADGVSLTVRDDAFFRQFAGQPIENAQSLGVNANLVVEDNGAVFTQFITQISASLSDASTLTLFGGGDPLGANTTVSLASDWTGSITFNNETPSDVVAEHLSQITVGGAPAVFGTNVDLVSNGGVGSILTLGTSPSLPTLTINRDTGRMLLENNTGASLGTIIQYDIQTAAGGFAPGNWESIADTGGSQGDGTPIGAADWIEFTAAGSASSDLSEGTFGVGLNFTDGLSLDLGVGSWIASPFEDIRAVLQDDSGNDIEAVIVYTGMAVSEGDFTGDGIIDELDWPTVRDNLLRDVSSLPRIEQYLAGDLTGDGQVNRLDFNTFKTLFEAESGPGSFARMLVGVPEPSGFTIGLLSFALFSWFRRPRHAAVGVAAVGVPGVRETAMRRSRRLTRAFFVLAAASLTAQSQAQLITWDGGGDGTSTFQEANWVVTDDTGSATLSGLVGMDPPSGFVDPQTDVLANVLIGGTGTAGGGAGGPHFDLGEGFSLTVEDDATYRGRFFGTPPGGIRGVSGGLAETLTIQDSGTVFAQFLLDIEASLFGAADLTFGGTGTGTFAGSTTLDLAADWTGAITWANFAGVSGSNIIDKITVGGLPAIEGDNIVVTSDGTQSILTIDSGLPDPSLLSLVVDPSTGLARIDGADSDVAIDYYEITSEGSFLNTNNWLSLQDQGIDGNTVNDGFGWEEAGGSSASAVAEAFLTGPVGDDATVGASSQYAFLGALFDGGSAVTDDLTFSYQVNGSLVAGNVIAGVVSAPMGVDGDYNNDGVVDAADYTVWRDNLNQSVTLPNDPTPGSVTQADYSVWANNFGQMSSAQSVAIPEPCSFALLALAITAAAARQPAVRGAFGLVR